MKKSIIFLLSLTCVTAVGCQSSGFKSAFRSGKSTEDVASAELAELKEKAKGSADKDSALVSDIKQASAEIPSEAPTAQLTDSDSQPDLNNLMNQAKLAQQQQDYDTAKQQYQKVLNKQPNHGEANHGMAVIADLQKNYSTANYYYKMALKSDPHSADLLNDIGYSYFLQKDYAKSEAYFQEVLTSSPSHTAALMNYGRLLALKGNTPRALELFRRAQPEVDAHSILAQVTGVPTPATPTTSPVDNNVVNALATGVLPAVNPFPAGNQPGAPPQPGMSPQPGSLAQSATLSPNQLAAPPTNMASTSNPFAQNNNTASMPGVTASSQPLQQNSNPFGQPVNQNVNSTALSPQYLQAQVPAPYGANTNLSAMPAPPQNVQPQTQKSSGNLNANDFNPFATRSNNALASAQPVNNQQPTNQSNPVINPFATGGELNQSSTLNTAQAGLLPNNGATAMANPTINSNQSMQNSQTMLNAAAPNRVQNAMYNNQLSQQGNVTSVQGVNPSGGLNTNINTGALNNPNAPWPGTNTLPPQQFSTPSQPVQQPYSVPLNQQPLFGQPQNNTLFNNNQPNNNQPLFNNPQSMNQTQQPIQNQSGNQLFNTPAGNGATGYPQQGQTIQQSSFATSGASNNISNANWNTTNPNTNQVVPAVGTTQSPNSPW